MITSLQSCSTAPPTTLVFNFELTGRFPRNMVWMLSHWRPSQDCTF